LTPFHPALQIENQSLKIFLSGTYLGNAFAGDYRYMRVWRRGKSGWQIVGGSVTAVV
jgi:hypothetical protein